MDHERMIDRDLWDRCDGRSIILYRVIMTGRDKI